MSITTPTVWNKRDPSIASLDSIKYIGRPSKWGNPYSINLTKGMDRATVIRLCNEWITYKLKHDPHFLEPLRGHHLVCWCKPLPCHGDLYIIRLYGTSKELREYIQLLKDV